MKVLLKQAETEIDVKKSKFISIAYPITALSEIKPIVNELKKIHSEANHVVHCAVVGKSGSEYSSSDDREPKNTAGRPSLEVLKGSGITNILVCTIRYFGGTLLGTGGLVKAYGDSVKEVLKIVETEELIEKIDFKILLTYDFYDQVKRIMNSLNISNLKEEFLEGITIMGSIALSDSKTLKTEVESLTNARCPVNFL